MPDLTIYDVTIGLFFLLRRMFVSQAVLQRDTTHCSYPIQGYFYSFSPQGFNSSSCREQIPKSTPQAPSRNSQERKCCCGLKVVFFFFDVNLQGATTVQSRGCSCVSNWMAKPRQCWCKEQAKKSKYRNRFLQQEQFLWILEVLSAFYPSREHKSMGSFKRLKQNCGLLISTGNIICSSQQSK